jgi:hypothetical protein
MTATYPAQSDAPVEDSSGKPPWLHYLDWLQVLAILSVFLFHADGCVCHNPFSVASISAEG